MTAFDITERVVSYLGLVESGSSSWSNSDFNFDYAVAGIPFLSAANDKSNFIAAPYARSFVPVRKDQVDQQAQPGENSLSGWWIRSQASWTGGAGIKYFEPTGDERVMRSFKDSLGVDCWTAGQLTLLNGVSSSAAYTGRVWLVQAGASDVYSVRGGSTPVIDRSGATTALTAQSTLALADDGLSFYRLTASGMFKGTIASGGESAYFTTTQPTCTTGTLAWVKSRLMAALNNSLYELTAATTGSLPTATYSHPLSGWIWSSICEGPAAIYAAGYAGNRSAIYKFALDSTMSGGGLPVLSQAAVAAELPAGERINHITTYLGRYMAVSTSRGVRVAVIDGNGDLSYGPLIWSDAACYTGLGDDRFFYVGTTLSSGPGLIRIDLSDPDQDGRFPYATDLQSGLAGSGYADNVVMLGRTSRKVFSTWDAANGYVVTESTNKVSSGWLRSGQVRFSTLEPKHFELVKVRWVEPLPGSITVSAIDSSESETSIMTIDSTIEQVDLQMPTSGGVVSYGVRLDLTRDGVTLTSGPTVTGWQLKAVPASTRKEMIRVPLLCFDFQRDTFKQQSGYPGFALDRYRLLRDTIRDGAVVTFQDLSSDEEVKVVVEDIQFEQFAPPGIEAGFGGILTVEMREV